MLNLASPAALRILVYTLAADMRKGISGLSGIVRGELGGEPTDGTLYLFLNRRRDRLKLLHFAEGGWWLYYRVLEAGTFEELKARGETVQLRIDATQLMMLLSGVALVAAERRRRRLAIPAA